MYYAGKQSATTSDPSGTGKYEENAQYYDVTATYATSTPLGESAGTEADLAAVALMQKAVLDVVAQFKEDGGFASITPEDAKTMNLGGDRRGDLQITYLSASSTNTVSYIYTIYSYTLGAHGNTTYLTFTFSTKDGSLLKLSDLFVPNASYLDSLSTLSRDRLPKMMDEESINQDFILDGTKPEEASFENFFLDGTSLVILFPPYAVAPYVVGTVTLPISVTELKNILKPEYQ